MTESVKAEILPTTHTKLTPELEHLLIRLAEATPVYERMAAAAGISLSILRRWIQLGDEGDDRYVNLAIGIHRARDAHHDRWMSQLIDVAETDDTRSYNAKVRALEMLLKQQFPKTWGSEIYVRTLLEKKVDNFNLKVLPHDVLIVLQKAARILKLKEDGADDEEIERQVAKTLKLLNKEKVTGGTGSPTEE